MQISMKEDMTSDEALMLLEVANAEVDSLRQQLDDAHQIIAHQAKLNEAAWENIDALREALEMIAGIRPCADALMGNADIARAALAQEQGGGDAQD